MSVKSLVRLSDGLLSLLECSFLGVRFGRMDYSHPTHTPRYFTFVTHFPGYVDTFNKCQMPHWLPPVTIHKFCERSEFIILSRAYHARIASELRFCFGHKSFYLFGIPSCLATSHKQMLKTPFNMTSSCIVGFQATSAATWAHFIHPLFIVLWQIAK